LPLRVDTLHSNEHLTMRARNLLSQNEDWSVRRMLLERWEQLRIQGSVELKVVLVCQASDGDNMSRELAWACSIMRMRERDTYLQPTKFFPELYVFSIFAKL
jgi:hypothetical protein